MNSTQHIIINYGLHRLLEDLRAKVHQWRNITPDILSHKLQLEYDPGYDITQPLATLYFTISPRQDASSNWKTYLSQSTLENIFKGFTLSSYSYHPHQNYIIYILKIEIPITIKNITD